MSSRNNKNKNKNKKQGRKKPDHLMRINQADASLLMESFPDTQIWNTNAEHEPRFGVTNSRDNKVYNVVQTSVNRGFFTTGTTSVSAFAQNFQIIGIANANDYLACFDQYRIMQVEIWIKPQPGTFSNVTGTMYTVIDYDDSVILTSELQANSYENVTVTTLSDGVYRRFRPHNAPIGFDTSTIPVSRPAFNVPSEWINSSFATIPHYGVKLLSSATGSVITFDSTIRYWAQFRNPI